MNAVPVLIIFRDQASYLKRLVESLSQHMVPSVDIHIIDHGTTYEPALEYLRSCGLPIWYRGPNHPRSVWEWDGLEKIVGRDRRYIVTDHDLDIGNANDLIAKLWRTMDFIPMEFSKIGPALHVDDLPDHYVHAQRVRQWEAQWWRQPIAHVVGECGNLYYAGIDTTFALYRPLEQHPKFRVDPAIRVGGTYTARHIPWYEDSANLSEEQRYYFAHLSPRISHWADPIAYLRG